MSIDQTDLQSTVHRHWQLFLIEGIILVLLGIAAIMRPPIATLTYELLVGWVLFLSGAVGLVTTLIKRDAVGFGWSLVSAIAALVAGGLLLWNPVGGTVSLTLVLIAFFLIEGIASIMFALDHREQLPNAWIWMLLSGIVDLFLGGMIFLQLPSSAAWAIGLLLGINMIFGGTALGAMAMRARQLAGPSTRV